MAADMLQLPVRSDTTTDFRGWIGGIVGRLSAYGWVQTSDTGQTATSSFATQSSNDTLGGYQIWGMNDTLQGTTPVYLKLEFGRGGAAGYPSLAFTVGFSTDGAGNINSANKTSRWYMKNGQGVLPVSGGTQNCYFSGSTNRFTFDLWDDTSLSNPHELVFSIERTKDSSGNDTSTGVVIYTMCGNISVANGTVAASSLTGSCLSIWLPSTGTPVVNYFWPAAYPTVQTSGILGGYSGSANTDTTTMASNGNVGVAVPIPFSPLPQNPTIGPLIYAGTDFTPYTSQPVTVYNTVHTYLVCGGWGYVIPVLQPNYSTTVVSAYGCGHPLIRYE